MSSRLTISEVQQLRARQEPIPTGTAPSTDPNAFKSPSAFLKPVSKRWDEKISIEGKNRKGSTLKGYATSLARDEVISLGTAMPTAEAFPWESIDFHVPMVHHDGISKQHVHSSEVMRVEKNSGAFELGVALNYGHSAGSPQLVRFLTEHVEIVHNPPYSDWECCTTCGNTSALELAFRTFCNRGDYILCEEYTYPGAVEAVTPLGVRIQGIKLDDEGLIPEDLDLVLSNWDVSRGPKPFLLYMIPTGHNPTGTTQPAYRRTLIYEVAEKHDLYIIEDDPYYMLQLGQYGESINGQTVSRGEDDMLSQLPPSYLSLDASGRVLRLDSMSKIIAPGLRSGWMTGSSQIIQLIISHHEVSVVSPSGVAQIMLYKLLDETWGHTGFVSWLNSLSKKYRKRRDTLAGACEMHMPLSVCNIKTPTTGMFLWINVDWRKHPAAQGFEGDETESSAKVLEIENMIFVRAVSNKVMVNKGSWFRAERTGVQPGVAFRLTFAAAPEKSLEEAAKRFGQALRAEFKLSQ